MKPFLLKYAKPCLSPNRATNGENYFYDETVDMVRSIRLKGMPLAIHAHTETGPMTKKADLEKGEDSKDRIMWR